MSRPKSEAARRAKIPPEGILAAKAAVEEGIKDLGKITYYEIVSISSCECYRSISYMKPFYFLSDEPVASG